MKLFSKRLLTMLLAAAMVFSLSGMTTFAAETDDSETTDVSAESDVISEAEEGTEEVSEPEAVSEGETDPEIAVLSDTDEQVAAIDDEETADDAAYTPTYDWYPGQDAGTYTIKDADELAGLSAIVNGTAEGIDQYSFKGQTITLSEDIVMNPEGSVKWDYAYSGTEGASAVTATVTATDDAKAFTPIGNMTFSSDGSQTTGYAFEGTFNGNGKTIENLYVTGASGYLGLFGVVGGTDTVGEDGYGVVENFTLTGVVYSTGTNSDDYVGAVCGKLNAGGTIQDVINEADVEAQNVYNVGGIVGFAGTPSDKGYTSNPSGYNTYVYRCANKGAVHGYGKVGGIVGEIAATVKYCYNTGWILPHQAGGDVRAGGIAGSNGNNGTAVEESVLAYCYNTGTITNNGRNDSYSETIRSYAGIAGAAYGGNGKNEVYNCYNMGAIPAGYNRYNSISSNPEGGANVAIRNNYSLESDSIHSYSQDETEAGIVVTPDNFKKTSYGDTDILTGLGIYFVADSETDPVNDGYPVLWWQDKDATLPTLQELTIATGPTKTSYVESQTFDPTGMVVIAKYSDGVSALITADGGTYGGTWYSLTDGYSYSKDALEAGQTSVEIDYQDKPAYQEITVDALSLTDLKITAPTKTVYNVGDTFDSSGMTFTAEFNSGEVTKELTAADVVITPDTPLALGDSSVTISYTYDGVTKSAEQAITVMQFPDQNDKGQYMLATVEDLEWFADEVDNQSNGTIDAILTADIDASESTSFEPIGNSDSAVYAGAFDGDGHTVTVNIDSTSNYKGLFGYVNGGSVSNVTVEGTVTGSQYIGGVVGRLRAESEDTVAVTNCVNKANVTATSSSSYAGGVIGSVVSGTVDSCFNQGQISGRGSVGGVVGYCMGKITNCGNDGSVTGSSSAVGGIIGNASSSCTEVSNCYNHGAISGTYYVGGVIGQSAVPTIDSCYNTATVTATSTSSTSYYAAGGIVGGSNASTITNVFNTGAVSGSHVGALLGSETLSTAVVTISNAYYLVGTADEPYLERSSGSVSAENVASETADAIKGVAFLKLLTNNKGYFKKGCANPIMPFETADHQFSNAVCTVCGEREYITIVMNGESSQLSSDTIDTAIAKADTVDFTYNGRGGESTLAAQYVLISDLIGISEDDFCSYTVSASDGDTVPGLPKDTCLYWRDRDSGDYYRTAVNGGEGDQWINDPITIEVKDHTWGDVTWDWATDYSTATASRTCSVCDTTETADGTITSTTTEPTKWDDGETVYTATATFSDGTEVTDSQTVVIPATGGSVPDQNASGQYELANVDNLEWFADQINNKENYTIDAIVTADIDASESEDFKAIGSSETISYQGKFDGDGHTITVNIGSTTSNYQGLFGYVSGGTVSNVTVAGSVTGRQRTAGVVGYVVNGGSIINCVNEATVNGNSTDCGGIVARFNGEEITNCINKGSVTSSGSNTGGVVGYVSAGEISYCGNDGEIYGMDAVGGVAGYTTANCTKFYSNYNHGEIDASFNMGGLIGQNLAPTIDSCYNTGNLTERTTSTSTSYGAGGLIGLSNSSTITNVFNTGTVTGVHAAALLGTTTGTSSTLAVSLSNAYYQEGTADQVYKERRTGQVTTENVESETADAIKGVAFLKLLTNNEGYFKKGCVNPILPWETAAHQFENGVCTVCGEREYITIVMNGESSQLSSDTIDTAIAKADTVDFTYNGRGGESTLAAQYVLISGLIGISEDDFCSYTVSASDGDTVPGLPKDTCLYWRDRDSGDYYRTAVDKGEADQWINDPITIEVVTEHKWGEATWSWTETDATDSSDPTDHLPVYTATATRTCEYCGASETAEATVTKDTTATATAAGTTTYTATATFEGETEAVTGTKEVETDAIAPNGSISIVYNGETTALTNEMIDAAITAVEEPSTKTNSRGTSVTAKFVQISDLVNALLNITEDDYCSFTVTCSDDKEGESFTGMPQDASLYWRTDRGCYRTAVDGMAGSYWRDDPVTIELVGHTWGDVTWTWDGYSSATASRTCTVCGETETAQATITSEETKGARATEEGETTYTATATFEGETEPVTDTKTEKIAPLDPNGYINIVYNGETTQLMNTTIDEAIDNTDPQEFTYESHGNTNTLTQPFVLISELTGITDVCSYTVTGSGDYVESGLPADTCLYWRTDRLHFRTAVDKGQGSQWVDEPETIEVIGHTWDNDDITWDWATDYSSCTATRECTVCHKEETVNAEVTSEEVKGARATEEGETAYTATATFSDGTVKTDTEDVTIAPLDPNGYINIVYNGETTQLMNTTIDAAIDTTTPQEFTYESHGGTNTLTEPFVLISELTGITDVCSYTVTGSGDYVESGLPADTCLYWRTDRLHFRTAVDKGQGSQWVDEPETIEVIGHTWGTVTWTWADDFSSATASRTCSVCGKTETVDATITETVTTEPRATEPGEATYTATATFGDGTTVTNEKDGEIAPLDPDGSITFVHGDDTWTISNADLDAAIDAAPMKTIHYRSHNQENTLTKQFVLISSLTNITDFCSYTVDAKDGDHQPDMPTDTYLYWRDDDGGYFRTAVDGGQGYQFVDSPTTITIVDHDWNVTWDWADDYSSATATRTCSVCSATETVTATVTSETTPPTTEADGQTVYTATAEFGDGTTATDTKTVVIPKLVAPTVSDVTITSNADNNTKAYDGAGVNLTVNATVTPDTAEVAYQWYTVDASGTATAIEGATRSVYTTGSNVSDSGTYQCEVTATNDGMTASDTASIEITITQAAQDISYKAAVVTKNDDDDNFTNPLTETTVFGAISYTSSDEDIATVDANTGEVTIKQAGTTTITATAAAGDNYTEATASYLLTVNAAGFDWEIDVNGDKATWDADMGEYTYEQTYTGDSLALKVAINETPEEEGEVDTITYQWYYFNPEVLGLIEIDGATDDTYTLQEEQVYAGEFIYVCIADVSYKNGGGHTLYCTIDITIEKIAQEISYAETAITKDVGEGVFTNTLTETTISTEKGAGISYTSSDESVATIDENGQVTIAGIGETTITATAAETTNYAEASASYTLTVNDHAWGDTTWTWGDNYKSATASRTCTICGKEDSVTTEDITHTTTATATKDGETTYTATATFEDGTEVTGTTTVETAAIDPDGYITIVSTTGVESQLMNTTIDAAIEAAPSQTFTYTSHGNENTITKQFVLISDLTGMDDFCSYTVTASDDYKTTGLPTDTYLYWRDDDECYRTAVNGSAGSMWANAPVTIELIAHTWSVEWSWADDYSSATADGTCTVCGATETADATITSETTPPEEGVEGKTVYTATATFGDGTVVTDTQTVIIPPLVRPTVSVTVTSNATDNTKAYDGAGVNLTANVTVTPDTAEITSYQWYTVDASGTATAIEGATSSVYTTGSNVSDSGTYRCEVTATNDGLTATESGDITITITQAAQELSYAKGVVTKYDSDPAFTNPLTETTVYGAITYTSSNEDIATVDKNTGEVTIVAAGTVTITATAAGGDNYTEASASYILAVNVTGIVWQIDVNGDEATWDTDMGEYTYGQTYSGDPLALKVAITETPAEEEEVSGFTYQWCYFDPDVMGLIWIDGATDDTYVLSGEEVYAGDFIYTCIVTVDYVNGHSHTVYCTIEITIDKIAQEISYATTEVKKKVGDDPFTNELTVTTLSEEEGAGITYTSSDDSIATVDENGEVTILTDGTVTITATAAATANYEEATASYTLTIATNKDALQAEYDEDSQLNEDDYTATSWAPFEQALENAKTVLDDDKATQAEVDDALAALQSAKAGLHERITPTVSVTITSTLEGGAKTYDGVGVTLTAKVECSPATAVLSYQWYKDGEAIEGETYMAFNIDGNVADSGTYKCEVTAANDELTATADDEITITINAAEQDISYAETTLEKKYGDAPFTNELTITQVSTDAGGGITYASSDESIATVDENGMVTILDTGTVTITATAVETANFTEATASYTVTIATNKDALQDEYDADSQLNEEDYTPATWAPFEQALEDAKTVLDNDEATQQEINDALAALESAKADLIEKADKAALEGAITAAGLLDESEYTEDSWAAMQQALAAAEAVEADPNASQDAADQAAVDLVTAIAKLTPISSLVDKTDLLNEVLADVALSESDYTSDTWAPFATALSDAVTVLADPEATQEDVDDALLALQTAKDNLEPEPAPAPAVDKEGLAVAIEIAEALNESDYTPESWAILEAELADAQAVNADPNATQDDVDNAVGYILAGIAQLEPVEKPDKTDLLDEYTEAMGLNESDYTPDTWDALEQALADAQSVLTDPNATADEVEAAEEALKTAMDNLEPAAVKDGLLKDSDGVWRLYKDNVFQQDYTGFAENGNGKWYVEFGVVTFTVTDILKDKNGAIGTAGDWYYVIGSKVQDDFTGLSNFSNEYGWWYIANGKVDFTRNSVDKNKNGWWYVVGGKVQFGYTGLANYKNQYGWWYIDSGKVNFNHNGVDKNQNGWWYVVGSKVQLDFTGLAHYRNDYGWWYIEKGKVNFNHNGVDKNQNGWWYVKDSKVDFSFAGIASNANGTWYLTGGKVNFNYSGTVTVDGKRYTVRGGRVS